jgi:ATP-binding cassette subfamily C protein CydC
VPLAVVTLTALAAFEAVSPLPAAAMQLAQSRAAACRIAEVMDATDPVIEPPSPRALPTGAVTAGLRDASLRYEPGAPLAIDGVTLELAPGRRVALVGPNGAGKSTVAAVLLRFRDLDGGSATLCGHDLGDYRADDIRTIIGGCPQDPHLFDSSIGENLALACPSASRERLGAAAAHVGLGAWIASLPDGLDTPVGPNGTAISGGQRQRIVLARALLADPAVLVLDEPTAHLDAETRRSVMDDLLAATQGRSVLLITHEMEGLEHLDEIVVLDQGKAAERGTHRDLIAAGGLYARLWRTSDACQANPDAVR